MSYLYVKRRSLHRLNQNIPVFRRVRKIQESNSASSCLCLSVRMVQLGSHWTGFHEIWYLSIFRKSVEKIQVSLKSGNNNGTLHKDLCTFMVISRSILLRTRNDSDKSCTENQNTHFMFNNFLFRKSCRLWDNVEKHGTARQATDDNIIRRMRFTCWITKATDTHLEYLILIAFPRQRLRERVPILCYMYTVCLVAEYNTHNKTEQPCLPSSIWDQLREKHNSTSQSSLWPTTLTPSDIAVSAKLSSL
jgi:hypothetical protein